MAKHLFQKGNSYGKGRPKGSGYVDLCREYAEKKGWQKLIDIAEGKDYKVGVKDGRVIEIGAEPRLQLEAIKTLIAYGFGRPAQRMEVSGPEQSEFSAFSSRDIETFIEVLKRRSSGEVRE